MEHTPRQTHEHTDATILRSAVPIGTHNAGDVRLRRRAGRASEVLGASARSCPVRFLQRETACKNQKSNHNQSNATKVQQPENKVLSLGDVDAAAAVDNTQFRKKINA